MAIKRYGLRSFAGALWLVIGCTPFKAAWSAELTSPVAQGVDSPSHWTLSVEAIALKRSNSSVNQPLISTLPGTFTFGDTANAPTTEVFNSNQFQQDAAAGPKFTVDYRGDSGYGFELSYFNVQNLNATNTVGPANPGNWYIMKAPGFWQTQDFAYQGMTWGSTTSLYSAEANAKLKVSDSFTFFVGFRWLQLKDSLVGSVTPADQNNPVWKTGGCAPAGSTQEQIALTVLGTTLSQTTQACASGIAIDGYPPFWSTSTRNNLFGVQLGAQGKIFEMGRLSFVGSLKAGVFNNCATQSDLVSITKIMYSSSATTNKAAYAGEGILQLKYLITDGLAIKMGYQLLCLDQVALAPGQIPYVYSGSNPTSITARGVNVESNILFRGGTVGLEYSF
ncbi:MAG: hypothetical protein WCG19_06500 [Chlorobiaceae bacterium]